MGCAFCGEGDQWIKTCRAKDGLIRVCDLCYEVLTPRLVIVPGDGVVTARCDGCGAYFNPREMAKFSPGGRHNAYSGTCRVCMNEGALSITGETVEETTKESSNREEDSRLRARLRAPLPRLLVRRG